MALEPAKDPAKDPTQDNGNGAATAEPRPLFAVVNLCPTRVHMAARRLPPKQKYDCPPFAVLLVDQEARDRLLRPSRNPVGGENNLHCWDKLRVVDLRLDVTVPAPKRAKGEDEVDGNDLPIDVEKFSRHFSRQAARVAWNPVWLPQGTPTLTKKQAQAWLKNYGVVLAAHGESYMAVLANETPDGEDAAKRPNRGKPFVMQLGELSGWFAKRRLWLQQESKRGVGIKDARPPFGPGSKAIRGPTPSAR